MPKYCLFVAAALFITLSFSSCALRLLTGLQATEEVALGSEVRLLRLAGLELRVATSELVIASEESFFAQLSRVKIKTPVSTGNSRLYIYDNGVRKYFGEATSKNTIRLKNVSKEIALPGELYKVNGNSANVRTGPSTSYSVFKTIYKDDLVLILNQEGNWFKIQIGKNTVGYILAGLLTSVVSNEQARSVNHLFPFNKGEKLMFEDNFDDNRYSWFQAANSNIYCGLIDGRYFIKSFLEEQASTAGPSFICESNSIITITTQRTDGTSRRGYGLIFQSKDNGYYCFEISGESYAVASNFNKVPMLLIPWTKSDHINTGTGYLDKNQLSIRNIGSRCDFYINNSYVTSIYNATTAGYMSVIVEGIQTVIFDDLKVYH